MKIAVWLAPVWLAVSRAAAREVVLYVATLAKARDAWRELRKAGVLYYRATHRWEKSQVRFDNNPYFRTAGEPVRFSGVEGGLQAHRRE